MTSNRVPHVSLKDKELVDKKINQAKVEKIEEIQKASEVEENATKARRFREMVEKPEEAPSDLPSPFELFAQPAPPTGAVEGFSGSRADTSEEEVESNPFAAYSMQPNASSYGVQGVSGEEDEESVLPQSKAVWGQIEEPSSEEKVTEPTFQEMPDSASRDFSEPKSVMREKEEDVRKPQDRTEATQGKKKKQADGTARAAPLLADKKEMKEVRVGSKTTEKEDKVDFTLPVTKGKGPSKVVALHPEERPKGKGHEKTTFSPARQEEKESVDRQAKTEKSPKSFPPQRAQGKEKKEDLFTRPKDGDEQGVKRKPETFVETVVPKKEREEGEKKEKEKHKSTVIITSPSLTELPPAAIPIAQAAVVTASSTLRPEILPIYFQMIGTIVAMVSPSGDSRTEFILNAPAFADSKFFGATITIERFATAPYSLNIRLTGSTEAVNAFNANIPNLLETFQNGKFSFIINRIDTAYDRPVFRRKESGKERDKGFGGESKGSKR